MQRMSEIPKLVASTTASGPLAWNATAIGGDVAARLQLAGTRTLDSGVVTLTYHPAGKA